MCDHSVQSYIVEYDVCESSVIDGTPIGSDRTQHCMRDAAFEHPYQFSNAKQTKPRNGQLGGLRHSHAVHFLSAPPSPKPESNYYLLLQVGDLRAVACSPLISRS